MTKLTPTERAAIEQKIEVFEEKISALREQLRPDLSKHLEYTPTSDREGLQRAILERCGASLSPLCPDCGVPEGCVHVYGCEQSDDFYATRPAQIPPTSEMLSIGWGRWRISEHTMSPSDMKKAIREAMADIRRANWETR